MLNDKTDAYENMEEISSKIKKNIETYFEKDKNAEMVYKFAMRLNMLIEVKKTLKKTSLTKISRDLEMGKSTLSEYAGGKKIPTINVLLKISNYFDVSIDYLLGRSETKLSNNDELNKRFGLNDNAIDKLEAVFLKEYINSIFDNDIDDINYLLEELKNCEEDYRKLKKIESKDKNNKTYQIEYSMAKRNLTDTRNRTQLAFLDLIDKYYKNK